MDRIKLLPKEFGVLVFFKIVLGVIGVMTIGALLVFSMVVLLYVQHFQLWAIVLGGWCTWLIFILVLALMVYSKNNEFKGKVELLASMSHLFAKEGIAMLNIILRKLHKTQQSNN